MKKLSEPQKKTLEKVVNLSLTEGFYLAGGTALTIKYSHRVSEDFDFFTFPEREIDLLTFDIKSQTLPIEWTVKKMDTLIFYYIINDHYIKFSFFRYPYILLEKPEFHDSLKIFIAKDVDIACMKAVAIVQRGSKKDFFDLWFLMNLHKWKLEDIFDFLKYKYPKYNPGMFLKALTYFEDAERESYKDIDFQWEEIKIFFNKAVSNFLGH
ncbi:MAG: nucleotidyl transferase AbiEii/AbiGii toxin family protein [Caldimicrobium sp.]